MINRKEVTMKTLFSLALAFFVMVLLTFSLAAETTPATLPVGLSTCALTPLLAPLPEVLGVSELGPFPMPDSTGYCSKCCMKRYPILCGCSCTSTGDSQDVNPISNRATDAVPAITKRE